MSQLKWLNKQSKRCSYHFPILQCSISELLAKIYYVEKKYFLLEVFLDSSQIFLIPLNDSVDLPLNRMFAEQIESIVFEFKKHSNENRTIIAGDFKLEFDNLKAVFNLMDEVVQGEVEKKICELTHLQILEAIA